MKPAHDNGISLAPRVVWDPNPISDARLARALGLRLPLSRTWCPVCGAFYFLIKKIGSLCGDLSRGQPEPCPGVTVRRGRADEGERA